MNDVTVLNLRPARSENWGKVVKLYDVIYLQPLTQCHNFDCQVYMFIYGCLGIIQGMFFTYLSATLSTLEKQFGIKSKESAYLVSIYRLQGLGPKKRFWFDKNVTTSNQYHQG
jgi:hypothetical protein